ncbi:MAG: hypothetical protein KQJ78_06515 [Deltaproteobacteria bacterium]|nr:hypothetical protein [Deltaproteobacteria bacterium]
MREYQKRLAGLLAESGALFFREGLRLKDGRPTPYFVNFGVFRTGRLAVELGRCFAGWFQDQGELAQRVDVIVGPSYKGSALAQGMAMSLFSDYGRDLAFDYDRKEAKTHGEQSGGGSLFVTGALAAGSRALIVDDVGTSMATKVDLLDKIAAHARGLGGEIALEGVVLAVDREQTQAVYDADGGVVEGARGEDALGAFRQKTGLPVWSLLGIRQAVSYLYEGRAEVLVDGRRQALDAGLLERFQAYLALYGREV